ncbi:hypothetical protein Aph01nite_71080 [Acrocarpospora phusangensis]|uniref:Uncharacterized protein n=1 Tax=Acrocarpospora phusangensis TaxID=1070424 RepID=A0A919QJI2_9ACTN|nr:hypothetical protein Aph01nite_71080 [Acrocarpospora phusangensis]
MLKRDAVPADTIVACGGDPEISRSAQDRGPVRSGHPEPHISPVRPHLDSGPVAT